MPETDKDRFEKIYKKYSLNDGSISFENRLKAWIEFIESSTYFEDITKFNKHDFEINKKAILDTFKHVLKISKEHTDDEGKISHKVWVDWSNF